MRSRWLRAPRVVLILLCAMYLIMYVNRVNISTLAPLIKADLKLNNTQLGFAFSAFAIPYAVLQLFGGWIGDRLGPRLTLTMCCAIVGTFTVLTGIAGGLASLVLFRLALGLGEGAAFSTATRALASWTPVRKWGFAQGLVHSFSRLGNAITPPLITLMLVYVSWRASFAVLGVVCSLWLILWFWYFRNDPRDHSWMTEADVAELPANAGTGKGITVPAVRLARRIFPLTLIDF